MPTGPEQMLGEQQGPGLMRQVSVGKDAMWGLVVNLRGMLATTIDGQCEGLRGPPANGGVNQAVLHDMSVGVVSVGTDILLDRTLK